MDFKQPGQFARRVAAMPLDAVGIDPLRGHGGRSGLRRDQPPDRLDPDQGAATELERLQTSIADHGVNRRSAEAQRPRRVVDRNC